MTTLPQNTVRDQDSGAVEALRDRLADDSLQHRRSRTGKRDRQAWIVLGPLGGWQDDRHGESPILKREQGALEADSDIVKAGSPRVRGAA